MQSGIEKRLDKMQQEIQKLKKDMINISVILRKMEEKYGTF